MFRLLLAIVLLLASHAMATAQVTLNSVTSSPAAIRVNDSGGTTVVIRWRLNLSSTVGGTAVVTSPLGATNLGNDLGGALNGTIAVPNTGTPVILTITESLFIDPTSAGEIVDAGGATYERSFTVAGGGTILDTVALTPSSGGALSIRNSELSFDDSTRFTTVGVGDPLAARLVVTSNGIGTFAGRWEVAGPSGTVTFRPIARVTRRLSGARQTVFESPSLRTDAPGTYAVRFVPETVSPRGAAPIETLRYTVVAGSVVAPQDITLFAPEPGVEISTSTAFSWSPVSGAARYRVQFTTDTGASLGTTEIAAVDVRTATARVRSITLARLRDQEAVFWTVEAYDARGELIGKSALRRLR